MRVSIRSFRLLVFGCGSLLALGCEDAAEIPGPSDALSVPDGKYVSARYFYIVDPLGIVPAPVTVVDVWLYLDDAQVLNDVTLGARPARVWLDPEARDQTFLPATGQFHLLAEETDFHYYNDRLYNLPFIELTTPLSEDQTLAVAYRLVIGTDTTIVGNIPAAETDSLGLQMLHPSLDEWGTYDLSASDWAPVRNLEAKNIYYLGIRNIEPGTLSLDVVQDVAGTGGNHPNTLFSEEQNRSNRLLQLLGLDQKDNASAAWNPDGEIDPEYLDLEHGLLFFPDVRPFDPSRVDIEGNSARAKSWPRGTSAERPDTLGWTKDPGNGQAILSSNEIRNRETVPELYDLHQHELTRTFSDHHIYSIEVGITGDGN